MDIRVCLREFRSFKLQELLLINELYFIVICSCLKHWLQIHICIYLCVKRLPITRGKSSNLNDKWLKINTAKLGENI